MDNFLEFFVNSYAGGFLLLLLGMSMIVGIWKNSIIDKPTISEDLIGYLGGVGFMLIGIGVLGCKIYEHIRIAVNQ